MEAAGSRPTDNLDSTARLMGEALAKASTELEKLFSMSNWAFRFKMKRAQLKTEWRRA